MKPPPPLPPHSKIIPSLNLPENFTPPQHRNNSSPFISPGPFLPLSSSPPFPFGVWERKMKRKKGKKRKNKKKKDGLKRKKRRKK